MNLPRTIERTLKQRNLLRFGTPVLVGVSGGADSVALAHVLAGLDIDLVLAHLHHGIRAGGADEDAAFVRDLASRLGAKFVEDACDVPARARRHGVSLEMAARDARYAFFGKAARKASAAVVATAHHADDQAETVLLRLARGAGRQGLSGMDYVSEVMGFPVIRPMLDARHEDAVRYLRQRGLTWREDESNRDVWILRNRVRHEILPLLEEQLNPRLREGLVRMAGILREEDAWLDAEASRLLGEALTPDGALRAGALGAMPLGAQRRVCVLWLRAAGLGAEGLSFSAVDRVLGLAASRKGSNWVPLADGLRVVRRYDRLVVERGPGPDAVASFRCRVKRDGETLVAETGLRVTTASAVGVAAKTRGRPGQLPAEAWLARKSVGRAGLYVRSWQPGDRFKPMGMTGSKKLQDLFVDAKVPREARGRCPVVECRGEVVWLPGHSVARGWEVPRDDAPSIHIRIERA